MPNGNSGQVLTSAGGTAAPSWGTPLIQDSPYELTNIGLAASVGSSAMTLALKQKDGATNCSTGSATCLIAFRATTASTGQYQQLAVTGALSTVLSSGSTGGSISATTNSIYVYAMNVSGVVELAWSGAKMWDEGSLQTSVAEGGAGAADSKYVLYSTTARAGVPVRLLGRVRSIQATAGTWATSPAEVSVYPVERKVQRSIIVVDSGNGLGTDSSNKIRRWSNVRLNIGAGIAYQDIAATGGRFTAQYDGIVTMSCHDSANTDKSIGVTLNNSAVTTSVTALTYAQGVRSMGQNSAANQPAFASWTGPVVAGDVLQEATNGNVNVTDAQAMCTVTLVTD